MKIGDTVRLTDDTDLRQGEYETPSIGDIGWIIEDTRKKQHTEDKYIWTVRWLTRDTPLEMAPDEMEVIE